jgi:hypothetical protein
MSAANDQLNPRLRSTLSIVFTISHLKEEYPEWTFMFRRDDMDDVSKDIRTLVDMGLIETGTDGGYLVTGEGAEYYSSVVFEDDAS